MKVYVLDSDHKVCSICIPAKEHSDIKKRTPLKGLQTFNNYFPFKSQWDAAI